MAIATNEIEMTRGMRITEARLKRPLETVLRELYVERELTQEQVGVEVARQAGLPRPVHTTTIGRWLVALGIDTRYIGRSRTDAPAEAVA